MNNVVNTFNNSVSTETIENFVLTNSTMAEKPNVKLSISQRPVIVKSKTSVIRKIEDSFIRRCEKNNKVMFVSEEAIENFLAARPDKKILEKQRRIAHRFVACK